ncbi:GNAT family N-acetyltransferase [Flavihumibacter rivuli]|uniref:GNAT family N-acetyltransferase n=1 Tax=Flavihumibacter rivuli TaxID=2838156 RepID=UPI001BDE6B35|nr:GNAT family N-acetyltransferase [Flavihumibacter rivuli]ULQ55041.1 GNAT family N-acetyltransferase [Flavihumibacter rivuli]
MSIELAKTDDIAELVELVNSAYRGEHSKKGWTHEADLLQGGVRVLPEDVKGMIQSTESIVLKCLDDQGRIIGCVYLKEEGDHIYLGMLTVNPLLQGGGIGKTLLQAAEAYALEKNKIAIEMTVISVRDELINWYIRNGYQPTGRSAPFPYRPGYGEPSQELSFIVLRKELATTSTADNT